MAAVTVLSATHATVTSSAIAIIGKDTDNLGEDWVLVDAEPISPISILDAGSDVADKRIVEEQSCCARCSAKFHSARLRKWIKNSKFGTWCNIRSPDPRCRLCQLLWRLIGDHRARNLSRHYVYGGENEFYLYAYSINDASRLALAIRSRSMVADLYGMLSVSRPLKPGYDAKPTSRANKKTQCIDWGVIRGWIESCSADHPLVCADAPGVSSLRGFQVIDCLTRKVVPASLECKFVALSYVWGTSSTPVSENTSDLTALQPPLIEDAIFCTRAMDMRYLWVDRYCIDQKSITKHGLIQSMDTVYAGATVTIVSTLEDILVRGLPGISRTREVPESVEVNGHHITHVSDISREIKRSKWNTRGWTYQESALSRRRLMFTTSQVHLQCRTSHYSEILPNGLSLSHGCNAYPQPLSLGWYSAPFRPQHVKPPFPMGVCETINEYLNRDLSYDSDILNAISGVLNRTCVHFWGLPLSDSLRPTEDVAMVDKPGAEGILQNHAVLLWTCERKAVSTSLQRRANFPSWSWVGWNPLSTVFLSRNTKVNIMLDLSISIRDSGNNRHLSFMEFGQTAVGTLADIHRFDHQLHITGWIADICIRNTYALTGEGFATFQMPASDNIIQCIVCPVLLFVKSSGSTLLSGIILEHIRNDLYERKGVLRSNVLIERTGEASRTVFDSNLEFNLREALYIDKDKDRNFSRHVQVGQQKYVTGKLRAKRRSFRLG